MWAGGRLDFHQPLRLGEAVRRESTIRSIQPKSGRSGNLVFVTVAHELSGAQGLAVSEAQDIVYRDPPPPGDARAKAEPTPDPDTPAADWRETVAADPVLLFRYSGLTMNGHRIHYDRPYATEVEGYDGLVVHGPLQATLLLSLARLRLEAPIARFQFRGLTAALDTAPLDICGRETAEGAELWVEQAGRRTFAATAVLAPAPAA
jgi:3-methylfumaryl-CoA hydratase